MTQADPLAGAWLKVGRGLEHLEELEAEIAAAPEYRDPVPVVEEFNPNTNVVQVHIGKVPTPPDRWALLAADCIQNFRIALNYLAWKLARWHFRQQGKTKDPDRSTQFPINTKDGAFSKSYITDLRPDHVTRIKELQPNNTENFSFIERARAETYGIEWVANHRPLGALARLSNDDKHRVLQPALQAPAVVAIGGYAPEDCTFDSAPLLPDADLLDFTLEQGAHWADVHVTPKGSNPKVNMKVTITPLVAFGHCPVEPGFKDIARVVSEILSEFHPVLLT